MSFANSGKEFFRSPVSAGSNQDYVLRLTQCRQDKMSDENEKECQIEIALVEGKKTKSAAKFGIKMTDFKPQKSSVKKEMDFSSGDGERGTELKVRVIQLDKNLNGLLITQIFGFEHVHREHFLFVAVKNKIAKSWNAGEGAGGPVTSQVEVLPTGDSIEGFIYQRKFFLSDGKSGLADEWIVKYFQWNLSKSKLEDIENKIPVWATILGTFKTLDEAIEFKLSKENCLKWHYVLSTSEYKKLEKELFIVTSLFTDKKIAEESLAKTNACDGKINGYIKQAL